MYTYVCTFLIAGVSPNRYGLNSVGDEGFMSLPSNSQQSLHVLSPQEGVSMSFNVSQTRKAVSVDMKAKFSSY